MIRRQRYVLEVGRRHRASRAVLWVAALAVCSAAVYMLVGPALAI